MKMTSQLCRDLERSGFWSATKGEFEQACAHLEGLVKNEGGIPIDVLTQIRKDKKFAHRLAQFIANGGVVPSEEELRAKKTGVRVITQGQVLRVFSWCTNMHALSGLEVIPSKIPFSDELLQRYAKTHVLLAGPPISKSLKDMEQLLPDWTEVLRGGGPYWLRKDWGLGDRESSFYTDEKVGPEGWQLIGFVPAPETSCVLPEEMESVIPCGHKLPRACDLVYAIIMWNYVVRTNLLPEPLGLNTSSKDRGGYHVYVHGGRSEWVGWPYTSGGGGRACKEGMAVTMVEPDLKVEEV